MTHALLEAAVADSAAYLRSPAARASVARDPYWPKWHSPWWHVLALREAGRLDAVPAEIARALADRSRDHFVPFFPTSPAELPPGRDGWLHVVCHCALASLLRVLLALGVDGEEIIPWSRGWFVRYQLPDGGWNCDERAYTRPVPRSSILSALPPLEYLLARGERRPLAAEEEAALDRGAAYLLAHRLVCSARTGAVLDAGWLVPCRPRFYEYDALRGLSFLVRWAEQRGRPLPSGALAVARDGLARHLAPGATPGVRRWHGAHQSRLTQPADAEGWGPVTTFPLLDALSGTGAERALVAAEWDAVQAGLLRLGRNGRLE